MGDGISDVDGNFCGWFINKHVWRCSTLETSCGRVCSLSLVFFVHWRRLIQFLFSLLNTVGRGCCSFLYNGYTRLQIFMDGGVRRSSLLNTASTADSNEIIESRF
jgi:hypothetical protein